MTKVNSVLKLCESRWSIQNFFRLNQNETMRKRCLGILVGLGLLIPGISALVGIPWLRDSRHRKSYSLFAVSDVVFIVDLISGICLTLGLGLLLLILGTLICLGRKLCSLMCGQRKKTTEKKILDWLGSYS